MPLVMKAAPLLEVKPVKANYELLSTTYNAPWRGDPVMADEIVLSLAAQNILFLYPMRDFLESRGKIATFVHEVYLAYLADGTKAVFKPRCCDELYALHGEVVAYTIARELARTTGNLLVPPTVVRDYEGCKGSLQWFIESSADMWRNDHRTACLEQVPLALRDEAALFAYVFQWENHPGNFMVVPGKEGGAFLALLDLESFAHSPKEQNYARRNFVCMHRHSALSGTMVYHDLGESVTNAQLISLLEPYMPMQKIKRLHRFFWELGTQKRLRCGLGDGGVWVQIVIDHARAFPQASGAISPLLSKAYEGLTQELLQKLISPLYDLDHKRFGADFIAVIHERIQLAFETCSKDGA